MKWTYYGFAALLALAVVIPAQAADPKKPDSTGKPEKDKKDALDKMVTAGQISGKVLSWDSDERSLLLEVEVKVPELDQNMVKTLGDQQRQLAQAQYERDPKARIQKITDLSKQLAQTQAKLYTYKSHTERVEMQVRDDVKVRMLELPSRFDDKGFKVTWTPQEIKELRGNDPKMPGYKGEATDIKMNAVVNVTLNKKKGAKPTQPGKPAEKQPDETPPIKIDPSTQATLILIAAEAPPPPKTNN